MKINNIESARTIEAKSLIDFSKYKVDEQGFIDFIKDFTLISKSKNQVVKDSLRSAGGYRRIFDLADQYFSMQESTVKWVEVNFFKLAGAKDEAAAAINGDDRGHRFTIMERYNHDWHCFQYASDFIFALTLCMENN